MIRNFVMLALLSCSFSAAADGSAEPAKDAFQMWLAGVNSGKPGDIQAFLTLHKKGYDVQDDVDFHEATGGLNLLRVTVNTGKHLQAFVRAKNSDSSWLVTLEVDPNDPVHVTTLQLAGGELPDDLKIQRWRLPELITETHKRLDALANEDKLSGTFLLAQNGKVLLERSEGNADRSTHVRNELNTRLRLASVGKMFTAVAILQLIDAGKIRLDDTIAQHLKNYPDPTTAKRVTIRQLLNHTSGLGEIFDDDAQKNKLKLKSLSDYITGYGSKPLEFEPGSKDKYANFGYIVLGAIIESASGVPYYDYVQQHIYGPARMLSTGSEPESDPVARRAVPYTREKGRWIREAAMLPWRGTSAGGGYSTVRDLLNFVTALRAGKLIKLSTLEAATIVQNNNKWYGYGFMVAGAGPEHRYGHEGGAPGMNAALSVFPDSGYVVIGLSNFDPSSMGDMVNFVGNRLPLSTAPAGQNIHSVH